MFAFRIGEDGLGIHFMASYDTQPPPIFISLYLSPDSLLMAVHPSFRVLQHAADTDIILLAGLYDPGWMPRWSDITPRRPSVL